MKPSSKQPRILGLDTFRFIAALWVVFCHCGSFPLGGWLDQAGFVGRAVQGFYNNLFPGVPAVTVFFVISGFCIHYPYRGANAFELWPYLTRRYLRIGIPLLAAVFVASRFKVDLTNLQDSILWSLVAELIYYSMYPFLRKLKARFGWDRVIAVSFLASTVTIVVFDVLNPQAMDYTPTGSSLNWLICLPSWLLGCRLAEVNFNFSKPAPSSQSVWLWRLAVWFAASFCSVLRFHGSVGFPWTLNFFAILVFFWLRAEIVSFYHAKPPRVLEWAGKWSYSIYLMHLTAFAALASLHPPDWGLGLNWTRMIIFVILFSYAFYLVVEKPGHEIAKRAAQFVKQRTGGKIVPPPQSAPVPGPAASELVK